MIPSTPEQERREDNRRALGAMLRNARRARKLSQASLAKAIGISAVHVSQVETGLRVPSDRVAKDLAIVLGLQWQEVLRTVYRLRSSEASELFPVPEKAGDDLCKPISALPGVRFLLLQLAGLNLPQRDLEALVRNWSNDLAFITQLTRTEQQ